MCYDFSHVDLTAYFLHMSMLAEEGGVVQDLKPNMWRPRFQNPSGFRPRIVLGKKEIRPGCRTLPSSAFKPNAQGPWSKLQGTLHSGSDQDR